MDATLQTDLQVRRFCALTFCLHRWNRCDRAPGLKEQQLLGRALRDSRLLQILLNETAEKIKSATEMLTKR